MSNNDTQTMIKYAAASIGALTLCGIAYYLSHDESTALDFSRYNLEKFQALMAEVQLEFTCIYCRNYNLLLKIKDSGEKVDGIMDQIRTLINKEMKDKTEQIIEDYCFQCHPESHPKDCDHEKECLTMRQFEDWSEQFGDEPFMVKQIARMEKLDDDLFVRGRIEQLNFFEELPEEMTAEKYLTMYKKIWAILRHDLYLEIQAKKKELRCDKLESPVFDKLYEDSHKCFEEIRVEVYAMIMDQPSIT